jgi:hypothetical protein
VIDVRGYGYTKAQINNMRTSDKEEQLIWDSLSSTNWANFVIYDEFYNGLRRESPEPYPHQLTISSSTLIDGGAVSETYGFTSITYTDIQVNDIEKILCDLKYDNSEGGDVKFEVSVDGGANYTTIVDTSLAIDNRALEIDVSAVKGNDVIVRLEITTDGSGNGALINYFSVIF